MANGQIRQKLPVADPAGPGISVTRQAPTFDSSLFYLQIRDKILLAVRQETTDGFDGTLV